METIASITGYILVTLAWIAYLSLPILVLYLAYLGIIKPLVSLFKDKENQSFLDSK